MIKLVNELGGELLLPRTMFLDRIPLNRDIPAQALGSENGWLKIGKSAHAARQFTIHGAIYYQDKKEIEETYDMIMGFFIGGTLKVYRQETDERFLLAELVSADPKWVDEGAELHLSLQMLALNPLWHGDLVTTEIEEQGIIFADGSAPSFPIITTVEEIYGELIIENSATGQEIEIGGAEGKIEIDCEDFVIYENEQSRLDLALPSWFLKRFQIVPGVNLISSSSPIIIK